jgi:hypothetical protein
MTNASSDSEGEFFDAEDQDEQSGVGKSGCSEALEERQTVATTGSGSGRVDCVQSHGDGGNEARRESKEHLQKPTVQQTEIRECEVANFSQKPSLSSENKQVKSAFQGGVVFSESGFSMWRIFSFYGIPCGLSRVRARGYHTLAPCELSLL